LSIGVIALVGCFVLDVDNAESLHLEEVLLVAWMGGIGLDMLGVPLELVFLRHVCHGSLQVK
jgi:hypothetical protein